MVLGKSLILLSNISILNCKGAPYVIKIERRLVSLFFSPSAQLEQQRHLECGYYPQGLSLIEEVERSNGIQ